MTFTRAFVYVLLLANIGLVALLVGPLRDANLFSGHAGEPERLSNQLNPERIAVSAPLPSPGPVAPTTAGIATSQPESATAASSAPLAAASEATAQPANEISCMMFEGLTPDQLQTINTAARNIDPQIKLKEKPATPPSYWVHLPPLTDREEAKRRVEALKAAGVTELFVVQDGSAMQNAISLGVYRNEASAKRQLDALQKKGVQGVRMNTRDAGKNGQIELNATNDILERLRRETQAALAGLEPARCATN